MTDSDEPQTMILPVVASWTASSIANWIVEESSGAPRNRYGNSSSTISGTFAAVVALSASSHVSNRTAPGSERWCANACAKRSSAWRRSSSSAWW
jgi:hypothetical protein